jgi:hypothetical protein
MDNSHRDHHKRTGHHFLHLFLGCGLVLLTGPFLAAIDENWQVALVLVALVFCPVAMALMMRRMPTTNLATSRRNEDHENRT